MGNLRNYKRRYDRAQSRAYEWWDLLEASYHYCVPNRNMFYQDPTRQGRQKNIKVYDTTQVAAVKNFVSKLHTSLTPPSQNWALFESSESVQEDDKEELDRVLQDFTDQLFQFIRQSNFDIAINECYYDLAVGTAVLVINEGDDDNPLQFSSIPLDQIAIEESANHLLETAFRTWSEIRVDEVTQLWPKAVLPSEITQQLNDDPNACIKGMVEAVIHQPENKKFPYKYVLWYQDYLLMEEEQESSAFIIFRWSKVNNEIFGRGVVIDALPSIISLQTTAYFELTCANLNICKPYMGYSDGIFNPYTFKLQPNTIIPVSPNSNGQFPLAPLPDVANPQFMQMTSFDLRQQINKLMFADPLGSVEQAPDRTATEVAIRQRNLAEEIGPIFTRLQSEFLDRTLERISFVLIRKGLIEKPKLNDSEVRLKYKSPLTISQGQQDVQSFTQYMQILASVMGPEQSLMFINTPEFPSWLGRKMGVDPSLINKKEDVEQMLQDLSEKQAQAQAQEQMQSEQQTESQSQPPTQGSI